MLCLQYIALKKTWHRRPSSLGSSAESDPVNFRHPAYGPDDNPLFTLYAWDHADGGIHHGFAHSACSIFADNRTDGYLSTTCVGEHGERVQAAWDEVLPAAVVDYYFYVPYPPGRSYTLPESY
jgi:hypothetical protein